MNRTPILFLNVLIIAACGLIYELLAGTVASYVLGASVTQFSLIIGLYLSALGVGAWLTRFIDRDCTDRADTHAGQAANTGLGQNGELISKARESLVSLGRLLTFVQQSTAVPMSQEVRGRFRTQTRDVMAMSDHASFLGTKVSFILDATLGLINIDQNNILKIFSVVTVFLLPPSVIGALFGMNFSKMPWLHETWGFWAAMGVMLASAIGPFLFFKRKGWL